MGKSTETVILTLLYFLIFLLLFVLIWASNKGLDLTDESYYLTGFLYPEKIKLPLQYFQPAYLAFFSFLPADVLTIRWMRLILTLLSSVCFSYGFYRYLKSCLTIQVPLLTNYYFLLPFITIGSLLSYSFGPQSLSYNSLSLILLQFIAGVFLIAFVVDNKFVKVVLSLIVGFLTGVLFLVKFSNAILLIPLLYILLCSRKFGLADSIKRLLLYTFYYFTGILLFILFFFHSYENIIIWIRLFIDSITHIDSSYSIVNLFDIYIEDFNRTFKRVITHYLWFYSLLGIWSVFYVRKKIQFPVRWIYSIFFILILIVIFGKYYLGGTPFKYKMLHIYILIMFQLFILSIPSLLASVRNRKMNQRKTISLIAFLSLPLVGALGTNNGLTAQVMFYMSFGFVFILLFILFFHYRWLHVKIIYVLIVLICIIATSQIVSGVVWYPYRLNKNLFYQTEKVQLPVVKNILFDKETANMLDSINFLLNNKTTYCKDYPVFTFRHEMGISYALGNIPFVIAWFNENYTDVNCFNIENADKTNIQNTILIIPNSIEIKKDFIHCMNKAGIIYPFNYAKIGDVNYLKQNKQDKISIYAPKNMLLSKTKNEI